MNATANVRPDRVVVVDDDARIRDLLRRYLTQELTHKTEGLTGLNRDRDRIHGAHHTRRAKWASCHRKMSG